MTQIEGWIAEMETYSADKRSGRSIGHSCMALKVRTSFIIVHFLVSCTQGVHFISF